MRGDSELHCARDPGQERVVHADDAAVAIHVDVQLGVVDGNAAIALLQVDVRRAGHLRVHDVRDCVALQVRGFEPERCEVVAHEVHRERHAARRSPCR